MSPYEYDTTDGKKFEQPTPSAIIPPLLPFYVKLLPDTQENRRLVEQLRIRTIAMLRDCDAYLYDNPHKTIKPKNKR